MGGIKRKHHVSHFDRKLKMFGCLQRSRAATNRLESLTRQQATTAQSAPNVCSQTCDSADTMAEPQSSQREGETSTSRPARRQPLVDGESSKPITILSKSQRGVLTTWSGRSGAPTPEKLVEYHDGFQQGAPASVFELSPYFSPESYTITEATSKLVGYMNYQEYATDYSRVNRYEMFYCQAPRQWIRLSISATVSVDSLYWKATSISSNKNCMVDLPSVLSKNLETVLTSRGDLEQGSHLSIYLGDQTSSSIPNNQYNLLMRVAKPRIAMIELLKTITSITYHWNCPRYSEKEVIQQPMYRLVHDNRFVTYFQSRWVITFRFGSDRADIDSNMYVLKVLHCLKSAPGINSFVGTLLDSQGLISGFMTELPLQGNLVSLLSNANKSGNPVGWERRERWCKQIINGVAMAHSQGFSIAALIEAFSSSVCIDGLDQAVICYFRREFTYDTARGGIVPPEYRHLASSSSGTMEATVQSDMYQLGLLIWMIASNHIYLGKIRFCSIAGCTKEAGAKCKEPHADLIELPSLGKHYPQYIQDIISSCRAKDPNQRLPAWKLLEMFPPLDATITPEEDGEIRPFQAEASSVQETRRVENLDKCTSEKEDLRCTGKSPTVLADCEQLSVHCDVCRKLTRDHFFHCIVCVSGDYDLCPECFAGGAHCLDDTHYMRELFYNPAKEEAFYTSMDHTGHRDIIKL